MVKVHIPLGEDSQSESSALAPRLNHLKGKKIALLSNLKPSAREVLWKAGELLSAREQIDCYEIFEKGNASYPAPEVIIERIATRCDAAVVALGD